MERIDAFLADSPIAARTRIPGFVVLRRTKLTPAELFEVRARGSFEPGAVDLRNCELDVGGRTVARGRLVKRGGRWHLKITAVFGDEQPKKGAEE